MSRRFTDIYAHSCLRVFWKCVFKITDLITSKSSALVKNAIRFIASLESIKKIIDIAAVTNFTSRKIDWDSCRRFEKRHIIVASKPLKTLIYKSVSLDFSTQIEMMV